MYALYRFKDNIHLVLPVPVNVMYTRVINSDNHISCMFIGMHCVLCMILLILLQVSHLAGRKVKTMESGDKDVTVVPNLEAIVDDFRILGRGLVSHIHVQQSNLKS